VNSKEMGQTQCGSGCCANDNRRPLPLPPVDDDNGDTASADDTKRTSRDGIITERAGTTSMNKANVDANGVCIMYSPIMPHANDVCVFSLSFVRCVML
jgi:hypothetical protein